MRYTVEEVMEFIEENNVKFIRLAICDIFGEQKNISIMPNQLEDAFNKGFAFDASSIPGFADADHPDLFLFPDPDTLTLLPWRPSQGRVVRFFCNIRYADTTPFELDSRYILSKAVERAKTMGIRCSVGSECEFYLFNTDEKGQPTDIPLDNAGYMDVAPADKGENIRREICLTLEEMGITPLSSHHEEGPGQNEIDFRYSNPLCSADDVITFRMVVRTLAARNGLYATFAPKPIEGKCGNGYHIDIAPIKIGIENTTDEAMVDSFMAGILKNIDSMTAFLNPTEDSYKRLGTYKAPKYISWARENRTQLMRVIPFDGKNKRIELRSPDSGANPYLALALLINAGLDGIERTLELCPPLDINMYKATESDTKALRRLPDTKESAIRLAEDSEFIRKYIPERIITQYKG
ncbi:MAG: glutamine synthetase [Ruminococcaceae bacterium]|nr:glutamine synthetase [Oscillospiraceae bacterium]